MTTETKERIEFKEVLTCPLCHSTRDSWDLSVRTLGGGQYRKKYFAIYACRECGIGISDPIPTEETSHLLYETRESLDFQGRDSSLVSTLKKAVADRDVRRFVRGSEPASVAPRLLDYACGNGAFALSMRSCFPTNTIYATDYHAESPPMLKGTDIGYSSYGDLQHHGTFDFILCRHVLEHTYDPVKFLKELSKLMNPGAVLMVEVPNLRAPMRKVFGKYWDGYYIPYHPIHFTKAALRRAVEDAGLQVEKAGLAEMPKMGRSLQNVFACEYNFLLFAAGVALHPLQLGSQLITGESTCLRIWARKPGV